METFKNKIKFCLRESNFLVVTVQDTFYNEMFLLIHICVNNIRSTTDFTSTGFIVV